MKDTGKERRAGSIILSLMATTILFWVGHCEQTLDKEGHPISVTFLNVVSNYPLNNVVKKTKPPIILFEFEIKNKTNHPIEFIDSCFSIRLFCSSGAEIAIELSPTTSGNLNLKPSEKGYVAFRAFDPITSEQLFRCNEKDMTGVWIEKHTRQITVVYGCGYDWEFDCERLVSHFSDN